MFVPDVPGLNRGVVSGRSDLESDGSGVHLSVVPKGLGLEYDVLMEESGLEQGLLLEGSDLLCLEYGMLLEGPGLEYGVLSEGPGLEYGVLTEGPGLEDGVVLCRLLVGWSLLSTRCIFRSFQHWDFSMEVNSLSSSFSDSSVFLLIMALSDAVVLLC